MLLWFIAAGVLAAWVALLYSTSWHIVPASSDNASLVLAGRDLMRGNVLLHGWHLGADSFWLLDLPLLGLHARVAGLTPAVFHVVPAAIDAVSVLLAMVVAGTGVTGRRRVAAALVAFVIAGLPAPLTAEYLLQSPMHVMTILACLVAAVCFAPTLTVPPAQTVEQRRKRLVAWLAGCLLLLITIASDPLALLIGAFPVAFAAASHARGAGPGEVHRGATSLIGGAVFAAVGAEALLAVSRALGAFRALPTLPLVSWRQWIPNLIRAARDFLYVLGVRGLTGYTKVARPAEFVHLAGVGLIAAGVVIASVSLLRRLVQRTPPDAPRWFDDFCVAGFFGSVAFYVLVVSRGQDAGRVRYLLPATLFGAILAGRAIARAAPSLRSASPSDPGPWRLRRGQRAVTRLVVIATGFVVIAGYVAEATAPARSRSIPNPAAILAEWLPSHGLVRGWGAYWDASITTVLSGERVRVLPVIAPDGYLHPYGHLAPDRWLQPDTAVGQPTTFVVYEPDHLFGNVDSSSAIATFGPPDYEVRVGIYEVLVWNHDTTARLRAIIVS